MITRPTLFILGAGASVPYGFPTGVALINEIVRSAGEACQFADWLAITAGSRERVAEFARALHLSRLESIDTFLEANPKFVEIGREAIALKLADLEDESLLFAGKEEEDWCRYVWNRMFASDYERFRANQVAFITFNHDRSLEHYLLTAMRNAWGKHDEKECIAALKQIPIIHVHGQLGVLPWQAQGDQVARPYKPPRSREEVQAAAPLMRIGTEAKVSSDDYTLAEHLVCSRAKRIIFLGFGYDESNLAKLPRHTNFRGAGGPNGVIVVYGSVYGMEAGRIRRVESRIEHIQHGRPDEHAKLFLERHIDLEA